MATFRPKRQWKPKRRDRNVARRRKRKRWWRRNRNQVKMKRRQRYRRLRNNPMFKKWRQIRHKEKAKRRFRMASLGLPLLPESWFLYFEKGDGGVLIDLNLGHTLDYDPDTEELLIYSVSDREEKIVDLDDFLETAEFLEEADIDNFHLLMDQYYGDAADDLDLIPEEEEAPPDFVLVDEGKAIVNNLMGHEPWFRGVGVGVAPDDEEMLVTIRVAPGHRELATTMLTDLESFPADFEVQEVELAQPRPAVVASAWMNQKVKRCLS